MAAVSRAAAAHQLWCTFTIQAVNTAAHEYTVDAHIALVAKAGLNISAVLAVLPPSQYMSNDDSLSGVSAARSEAVGTLLRFKYGQCQVCISFADPNSQLPRSQACVASDAIFGTAGLRVKFTHATAYSVAAVWLECPYSRSHVLSVEVNIAHAINVNVA